MAQNRASEILPRHAQSSTSCVCPKTEAQYVVFTFLTFDDGGLILVRRYCNPGRQGESLPASYVAPVILVAETNQPQRTTQSSELGCFPRGGNAISFPGRTGTIGDEDERERWLPGRRSW